MEKEPTHEELLDGVRDLEKALSDKRTDTDKAILKIIPDLIFRISKDGVHLGFYAPSLDQLFVKPNDFLGRTVRDVMPADVAEKYMDHIRKAIKENPFQSFIYNLKFSQNDTRYYEARLNPINEEEVLVIVREITDRITAEENLHRQQRMLKRTEKITHAGSWEWEIATDTVTWSEELYRIFQLDPKGKAPSWAEHAKLYHPEDFESLRQAFKEAVTNGTPYELELRAIRKDGKIRTCQATGLAERDRAGNIVCLVGSLHDITDRKSAEIALHQSQERYLLATEGGKVGVWDWNLVTGDMFVSPNLKKLLGYDDWEIQNNIDDWSKNVYSEDAETAMKEVNACIEGKKADYQVEHRMVHKDGSILWFLASGKVDRDENGRPIRFLGTDTDITKMKELEEKLRQSHKMEALGTLSGGIAHEFNNILGIIIGNTELAIDDMPEWSPAKDCLKEIRTASLRAKDVVRQVMSFSRKTPDTRKPIRIRLIIQESLKLMRATIPENIEIRQEILCDNELILANPTEINQILMNLCRNSVDAIEKETGKLKIRLETVALDDLRAAQYNDLKTGDYVKLTVTDNGEGIDPKLMGLVFDPYFTTKDVDKGLGMGLAVVYGIVKKHDGAIRINSKVGKGTSVEVLFPITKETAQIEREASKDLPRGTERILLVDDEASLVKLFSKVLERQGYEVVGKTSSNEALKLFQEESDKFDLVITDMAMPEMTGDRLAQELFKIRSTMPVIVCTGHSDRMDEEKAIKSGFAAFTMKPVVITDFVKTVRKVLDEAKK